MQLKIRLPPGLLFSIFEIFLLAVGLASSKDQYQRPLSANTNFWQDAVILFLATAALGMGLRGQTRLVQDGSYRIRASERE